MKIMTMPVGLIGTNCYILSKGNEALIIDPGGDPERIQEYIDGHELNPLAILLTHAHYDHIGALEDIRKAYDIEVHIHEKEQDWLANPAFNGSHKLPTDIIASEAENLLEEGMQAIGDFHFEVIHTPGHSPGSVSFFFKDIDHIFSGDVLFNQGIGRTDLPGGDFAILEHSIKEKLYRLADEVEVHPGHGPSTKIGFEKENNPFFSI